MGSRQRFLTGSRRLWLSGARVAAWLRRGLLTKPCGNKRLHKGFLEIEYIRKILALVGVLPSENLLLDEIENHVAHVLAQQYAPLGHYSGCHRTELLQREIAESGQQFRAGDVAGLTSISLRHPLEREIQGILEKKIRVGIKSLIPLEYGNHGLLELHSLHTGNLKQHGDPVNEPDLFLFWYRVRVQRHFALCDQAKYAECYA